MKKGILLGALSASLISGMAAAGNMGPVAPEWRWVGAFSAGPVWEDGGSTQTFYITPEIEKSYRAHKTTNTLGNVTYVA